MASFLLFVLLFASQVIVGFNTQLPPPILGKRITILSIDGGALKGIIPAVVLDHLDKALKAKDPTASLADYFDVIAGTSTGGLMTAMLATPTSPSDPTRPFSPSEIVDFYRKEGPYIFENPNTDWWKAGPKFNGTYLHNIIRKLLNETRLSQTLSNVVIPTFDIKILKPIIFSSYKLNTDPNLNVNLSDICIGTSAAPTEFPPYKFKSNGIEYNLIDGAVTADNPMTVAVTEVMQHHKDREILLLSVGTGQTNLSESYDADDAATWFNLLWIVKDLKARKFPILASVASSGANMIHYYLSMVFPSLKSPNNYLRIQEYDLDPSISGDDASKENLDNLEKAGKDLLQENVMRMDVNTFVPFKIPEDITNAQALDDFARKLYEERQLRFKRQSMKKGGRPFIETAARVSFGKAQATSTLLVDVLE